MAAADLVIMALYFGGLSAMLSSKTLRRFFPGREEERVYDYKKTQKGEKVTAKFLTDLDSTESCSRTRDEDGMEQEEGDSISLILVVSGIVATCLTWGIVELSIAFENITSKFIPGMGCGAIAILTMGINRVMTYLVLQTNKSKMNFHWFVKITQGLDQVTIPLSAFCFQLLFAAIGVSANIQSVVRSGLSSLVFAALALIVHMTTVLLGSFATMRLLKDKKWFRDILPLSLEEVLVASNAAIGGSATAAAFAGNIVSEKDGERTNKKGGLVLAATIWGVIGYSVATTVGVSLSKQLISAPSFFL